MGFWNVLKTNCMDFVSTFMLISIKFMERVGPSIVQVREVKVFISVRKSWSVTLVLYLQTPIISSMNLLKNLNWGLIAPKFLPI